VQSWTPSGRLHWHVCVVQAWYLSVCIVCCRFSPAVHSQWVVSRQHSADLFIGDAAAIPPTMRLRTSSSSAAEEIRSRPHLPPLGHHAWEVTAGCADEQEAAGSARVGAHAVSDWEAAIVDEVTASLACAVCVQSEATVRTLAPTATRVGCTSLQLEWDAAPFLFGQPLASVYSLSYREVGEEESAPLATQQTKQLHTRVSGLQPGHSYEFRLAVGAETMGGLRTEWRQPSGPPAVFTTSIPGDFGGWPLQVFAVPPPARPQGMWGGEHTGEHAPDHAGLEAAEEQCSVLWLQVPAPPDCGTDDRIVIELRSGAGVSVGDGGVPAADAGGGGHEGEETRPWVECTHCEIVGSSGTSGLHDMVAVRGLAPSALYQFRAVLVVKPLQGSERRVVGPATRPVMGGWPSGPLLAPAVQPTSSASFTITPPHDPARHCRGTSLQWEVDVRRPSSAAGTSAFLVTSAAAGSGGWERLRPSQPVGVPNAALGAGVAVTGRYPRDMLVLPSLRCPGAGCEFRVRPKNVQGVGLDALPTIVRARSPLPPPLADEARLELRLAMDLSGSDEAGIRSLLVEELVSVVGGGADGADGIDAASRAIVRLVRLVEARFAADELYFVIDTSAAAAELLQRALFLRITSPQCTITRQPAPATLPPPPRRLLLEGSEGAAEIARARRQQAVAETCSRLQKGKLTAAIDGTGTLLAAAGGAVSNKALWQIRGGATSGGGLWDAGWEDSVLLAGAMASGEKASSLSSLMVLVIALPLVGAALVIASRGTSHVLLCCKRTTGIFASYSSVEGLPEGEEMYEAGTIGLSDHLETQDLYRHRDEHAGWEPE